MSLMATPPGTPPILIDIMNLSVSVVRRVITGSAPNVSSLGSATGFFFQQGVEKYLVTNRHVVVDEKSEDFPDALIIKVHTSPQTLTQSRDIKIPLYSAGKPIWLEHPTLRKKVDVVVLNIGTLLQPQDVVACWKADHFLPPDVIVDLGAAVAVMGYPMGFYDSVHNLPIVRSGTVASAYRVNFRGEPLFLIDANLHPGTSGSPVFVPASTSRRTSQGVGIGSYSAALLGINSGGYSVGGVDLGLNAAWYSGLIPDIVGGQTAGTSGP